MHWFRLTPLLALLGWSLFGCSLDDRAVQTGTGDTSTVLAVLGAACSEGAQCALGFCVDEVCCESACDQLCELCSAAGQCEVPSDDLECPVVTCPASDSCRSYAAALNEDRCASRGQCKTAADCVPTLGAPNQLCSDSSQATESRCDAQGECIDTGVPLGGNCEAGCVDECELCTSASVCEVPPTDSRCPEVNCSERTSTCGTFSTSSVTSANLCRELGTCKTLDDCEFIANPGLPVLTAPAIVSPFRGAYSGSLHAPASAQTLRPRFEWSSVDSPCGGVSYQLQVDDSCVPGNLANCDFASAELATVTNQNFFQPTEDLPVSTAAPVGAYYTFRVRACDDSGRCSVYSEPGYLHVGRTRHDVNGDGFADLVVSTSAGLDVLLGGVQFNAFFDARIPQQLSSPRFAGDLNSDGFEDLTSGAQVVPQPCGPAQSGPNARILFGAADPAAATVLDLCNTVGSSSVVLEPAYVGDLDGDGFADLGLVRGFSNTSNNFQVYGGGAQPGSAVLHDIAGTDYFYSFNAMGAKRTYDGGGDLNGDAYSDVLAAERTPGEGGAGDAAGIRATVHLLLGGPGASQNAFADSVDFAPCLGGSIGDIAVSALGDPNGDSFGDWAVICRSDTTDLSSFGILRGGAQELGSFAQVFQTPLLLRGLSSALDFDNDGSFEVFIGNSDAGFDGNPIILQTESPVPSPLVTFGQPLSSQVIQVADHNGDNRPDLAVSGNGISWLGSAASFNVTPLNITPPEDLTSTSGIAF